ncbi:MAG: LysM peptidoglycan-binding domain-containing protein, partial [Deltaproteobacteria bacterium]
RGIRVGPADRQVDIVEPVQNDRTIKARIVAALYPHQFYGQHQVVVIDKGGEDGVQVGNRFFAVSRSDEWRLGLKNAGNMASKRAITEDDRMARVEPTPNTDQPELYPAETYAELRVLRVRKHTSTCSVTASIREITRGALVIAREGY